MKTKVLDYIDFEKVNTLLEGFNKSTGFVTAILDLEGNVLSKSGWRTICTEFHRVNPETAKRCTVSDTELAGKLAEGEKYHFYKCLNGLVDVAVPIVINGEHIANLFSGQFFFEEPDRDFFKKQAEKYKFKNDIYLKALEKVPVVSQEKVKEAMDFLQNMTQLISEMTFQKLEQMELNRTIRESEERFSKIFKASPIAISIITISDGRLTQVNDTWTKLMGFSAEEALGRNVEELGITDPETRNEIRDEFLNKGKLVQFESNITTKNGEKKSILSSVEEITIGNDQFSIILVMDITERKKSEKTLRESERRFSDMLENIYLIAMILDTNGMITFCNDYLLELTGWKREEVLYSDWFLNFIPTENTEVRKVFINSINCSEVQSHYENPIKTKSGELRYIRWNNTILRDAAGKIMGIASIGEDISERKTAEDALKLSEEKFAKAFRLSPYLVTLSSMDGRVVEVNDNVFDIFGYTKDEFIGKTTTELQLWANPNDRDIFMNHLEQYGSVLEMEIKFRNKSNEIRDYLLSAGIIELNEGQLILAIVHDITERKLMEEKIRKMNTELEQRVMERTSQLEAANKELEAFSYSVSHDLRSPLRHINGFAEILTKQYSDDLPGNARKHLNTITDSAKKMGILIDDLISFSRTGRTELKKATLKMDQVIEDALTQIQPSLKDRKIDWKISHLPQIHGDCNLLRQVWINLMDNAVKYTRTRKSAVIQIGFIDNKREIVFYIKDNGVGFDMKYAQKLFGVFQRLHSSSQFEGTGIGLANVQRIILRHGGRVWAEAETDKGATFYFSIPK